MLNWLLCILKMDWKKIYKIAYKIIRLVAQMTPSNYDDKKVEEINALINAFIGDLNPVEKAVIAKVVTKENKIIPDIDLNWNEKEGFKVSTKLTF